MKHGRPTNFLVLALSAIGITLGGCGNRPPENIKIEGLPYSFPRSEVERFVRPSDGMTYVRLKESAANYILILDSMVDRDERERGYPVIASLNFSRYAKTETVDALGGAVICRDRVGLNCGVRIDDAGIRWSVIFSRNDIVRAPGIRRMALRQVQSYRPNVKTRSSPPPRKPAAVP